MTRDIYAKHDKIVKHHTFIFQNVNTGNTNAEMISAFGDGTGVLVMINVGMEAERKIVMVSRLFILV